MELETGGTVKVLGDSAKFIRKAPKFPVGARIEFKAVPTAPHKHDLTTWLPGVVVQHYPYDCSRRCRFVSSNVDRSWLVWKLSSVLE